MMRGLFGLVGLLLTLVIVGLLVRKQMSAGHIPAPLQQTTTEAASPASATQGHVASQSQQIQQQVKQAMEAAMQARPMPDDK